MQGFEDAPKWDPDLFLTWLLKELSVITRFMDSGLKLRENTASSMNRMFEMQSVEMSWNVLHCLRLLSYPCPYSWNTQLPFTHVLTALHIRHNLIMHDITIVAALCSCRLHRQPRPQKTSLSTSSATKPRGQISHILSCDYYSITHMGADAGGTEGTRPTSEKHEADITFWSSIHLAWWSEPLQSITDTMHSGVTVLHWRLIDLITYKSV